MTDTPQHTDIPPTTPEPIDVPAAIPAEPVLQQERIASIDVLRGFALCGILLMNIQSFSMVTAAYMNPTVYGDLTGANYWVWAVIHVIADTKMMAIFSMLFGAGLIIMTSRAEQRTGTSASVHYRRMGILAGFGLLHAHLLWYGDILFMYAMCGMLVYLMRRLSPGILLMIALAMLFVGSALSLATHFLLPVMPQKAIDGMAVTWSPAPDDVRNEVDAYQGSWFDQALLRTPMALSMQFLMLPMLFIWRAGGLMLLGMALYKWGVFSAKRSKGFYAMLVAIGALVGVPSVMFEIKLHFDHDWAMDHSMMGIIQINYWAGILVALGWVGVVMLWCRLGVLAWLRTALAAVGQMALTNYLLQTVISTTIFYGHGFGLYGTLERTEQLGIVVLVWCAQLVFSPIWLKAFRYGPMEWLWRSLTYGKAQPMRRAVTS